MSAATSVRQISDAVKPYIGITPQSTSTAATVHGTGVDRISGDTSGPYESCDMVCMTGASTGGPGIQSSVFVLEHCATLGGTYVAYTDPSTGAQPSVTIAADNTVARYKVNLIGANQFIRVTLTTTYSTISAQLQAAVLELGGSSITPTPT